MEFFKEYGVSWFALDTDGNPIVVIVLFMVTDANIPWPVERAASVASIEWRMQFD